MALPPEWYDGLDELQRGLWRSAEESFTCAADQTPRDPRPNLGRALCLLARGEVNRALVLLETTPELETADPLWTGRVAWLRAVARLRSGDAHGAEQAAAALDPAARRRVAVEGLLRRGRYAEGIEALLEGRRRR